MTVRDDRTGKLTLGAAAYISGLAMLVGMLSCDDSSGPLHPSNHSPVISLVTAIPESIGPSDSVIVTCNATDPDGDPLVYDWVTDSRLEIQNGIPNQNSLYNTTENWHVFYNANLPNPISDTAWVRCHVRDNRLGEETRRVEIYLR